MPTRDEAVSKYYREFINGGIVMIFKARVRKITLLIKSSQRVKNEPNLAQCVQHNSSELCSNEIEIEKE